MAFLRKPLLSHDSQQVRRREREREKHVHQKHNRRKDKRVDVNAAAEEGRKEGRNNKLQFFVDIFPASLLTPVCLLANVDSLNKRPGGPESKGIRRAAERLLCGFACLNVSPGQDLVS